MLCDTVRMNDHALDSPHERLAWARVQAGYPDKKDFAVAVGVNPTTYRAYENGQNGFAKYAPVFAKKLGVSGDWLLDGGPKPSVAPQEMKPLSPVVADDRAVTLRSFDLSYSMGPGTNIDDYVEEGTYDFDRAMLAKLTQAPPDRLFVARADGDSMFPTLLSEDLVVIDTTQRVVNLRDRIWACSIYGAGAIKRLRPAARGKMEIISDNPAVKDDLVDADDIHIVGRVIWLGRRI
ncbi:LexA family transcriptional regulator [Novosphingobium fluoreni]